MSENGNCDENQMFVVTTSNPIWEFRAAMGNSAVDEVVSDKPHKPDLRDLCNLFVPFGKIAKGRTNNNHSYLVIGLYGGTVYIAEISTALVSRYVVGCSTEPLRNDLREIIYECCLGSPALSAELASRSIIPFLLFGYNSVDREDRLCNRMPKKAIPPTDQKESKMNESTEPNTLGNILKKILVAQEEKDGCAIARFYTQTRHAVLNVLINSVSNEIHDSNECIGDLGRIKMQAGTYARGKLLANGHKFVVFGLREGVLYLVENMYPDGSCKYTLGCTPAILRTMRRVFEQRFGELPEEADEIVEEELFSCVVDFLFFGKDSIRTKDWLSNRINNFINSWEYEEQNMTQHKKQDMINKVMAHFDDQNKKIKHLERDYETALAVSTGLTNAIEVLVAVNANRNEHIDAQEEDLRLSSLRNNSYMGTIKNLNLKLKERDKTIDELKRKLDSTSDAAKDTAENNPQSLGRRQSSCVEFRQMGTEIYALHENENGMPEVSIVVTTLISGGTLIVSPHTTHRAAFVRVVIGNELGDCCGFPPYKLERQEDGTVGETHLMKVFDRLPYATLHKKLHQVNVRAILAFVNAAALK